MSDAYERERQNNSRLDELSAKVTALRGVTVDIYDNARAQDVIDNTVFLSPLLSTPFPIPILIAIFTVKFYLLFTSLDFASWQLTERIERDVFFDEHIDKKLCESHGEDGCVR
ncbi:hypothetical protein B7494_g4593 [Chlorociboria aeruginascens]|nr:hypothetical protein B7494_g4593 [Chlorociboria aeruginascens]